MPQSGKSIPGQELMKARTSVRNRVIAGLAVIVLAFCCLVVYSIVLYRNTVSQLSLINTTYLPLTLGTSKIRATQLVFNTLMDRLADDPDVSVTRDWLAAARRFRPATLSKLTKLITQTLDKGVSEEEESFLIETRLRLGDVRNRFRANEKKFADLFTSMDMGHADEAMKLIESLKRSERLLDRVLAGIGEDVERHITEVSEEAVSSGMRATWGLGILTMAAMLVGLAVVVSTSRLLTPLRRLQSAVALVAQGEMDTRLEVNRDDEIGVLAASFNRMTDALAERDKMLIRSERLATAGKIAAQVTHEIRNPLSSLGLNAEMLEEELQEGATPGEAKALLAAMQDEIERLTGITEAYLRFARLPTPKLEYTDINKQVAATLEFLDPDLSVAGIDLETNLGQVPDPVLFDKGQIRQALMNLVRNAVEAMPRGGRISISTRVKDEHAEIRVSDTGPGIDPETASQIFEAFYTTKSIGTGLGLALVRQICLAHGGEITHNSPPKGGSEFTITLPMEGKAKKAGSVQ